MVVREVFMRERGFTSPHWLLLEDPPAHLLKVVEVECQALVTLLGQAGQLPVTCVYVGDQAVQSKHTLSGYSDYSLLCAPSFTIKDKEKICTYLNLVQSYLLVFGL